MRGGWLGWGVASSGTLPALVVRGAIIIVSPTTTRNGTESLALAVCYLSLRGGSVLLLHEQ